VTTRNGFIARYRRFAVLLAACALAGACSSGHDALEQLRWLCARDAGLTINRSVRAKGYYDSEKKDGALRILLGSDFEFIEFCDDSPHRRSMLDQPGCGRYRRVAKDSGLCDPRIDGILEESVVEPYVSFKEHYCVEFERIERPAARYSYESSFITWQAQNGVSRFARSEVLVRDAFSSAVLGRYVSYSLDINPLFSAARSCARIDRKYPTYRETHFVETVLLQP
jgi:hypothetical protein